MTGAIGLTEQTVVRAGLVKEPVGGKRHGDAHGVVTVKVNLAELVELVVDSR